jgi:adenine-specific DNA-methyltransferase
MAAIDDLINQIPNVSLRERIKQEVNRLQKNKKFGLVYEEHLPEYTELYDAPIIKGSKVALKGQNKSDIYIVTKIINKVATCKLIGERKIENYQLSDLTAIAEFGDPIYPYLQQIDNICNNSQSQLWHQLIEADNYHALQLLEYIYSGKIDCIYIDPPYNTGAKDWKYNNDYVDSNDEYRHSKWLSFMEKRLKLARKLLNPKDSTLIITIDEKEYIHLGALLEQIFPEAKMQMITTVINPKGVSRIGEFSRVDEYIYVLMFGDSKPIQTSDSMLTLETDIKKTKSKSGTIWLPLKRSGSSSLRTDRPNLFYPIYVDKVSGKVKKVGSPVPENINSNDVEKIDGCDTILPIKQNGTEGRWQLQRSTVLTELKEGTVRVTKKKNGEYILQHLNAGAKKEIENGSLKVVNKDQNGALIIERVDNKLVTAKSVWNKASHDATTYGTNLLKKFLNDRSFPYPKSLYAVKDILNLFIGNKKDSIVLDFFAGSGTTLHAVNLLNKEDGGNRQCILVTNNEVSDSEASKLRRKGYQPGDNAWESKGIAQYVTWPRTVCSIIGKDIKGNTVKDEYLDGVSMSDGFATNVVYFKLGFLEKNSVALGMQLRKLLSILWMKAGAKGKCPIIRDINLKGFYIFKENKFAILVNENNYAEFMTTVNEDDNISTVYIITDSEAGYHEMISHLNVKNTYQLYKDYLDNFRINTKG